MKKCLKILNPRYYDFEGKEITIGGVQTYITNLAEVAYQIGMHVEVFQFATNDFDINLEHITIHGVKSDLEKSLDKNSKMLYRKCMHTFDCSNDLLLFGSDIMLRYIKAPFALAIQHGIGWDIESEEKCSRLKNIIHTLRQFRRSFIYTKCAASVKKLICVDYNYINWYRTQILHHEMEYAVIPNFTVVPAKNEEKFQDDIIRIIFARRLVKYRGTRLFSYTIERLLKEYDNLEITFAGDGPEEKYLKELFKNYSNVNFCTYKSEESLEIHRNKHIAVVPTVGSEGTSLSLLEAMASTCAVVCTNIGGMTNIVIDNFNGLIVNPEKDQVYEAMKKLIEDEQLRRRVATAAYNTVQNGFSIEVWTEKWKQILKES